MSLSHFFLEDTILADSTAEVIPLRLSPEDAKHFKVLRLRAGEHIALIDAASDYFECEIVDPNWDAPTVRICGREDGGESGPRVILMQGIAKGDKLDTVVRQGTEVGMAEMLCVPFARCDVTLAGNEREHRLSRFAAIAKSAAMQAGRRTIPPITVLDRVEDAVPALRDAACVLLFWEEAGLDDTIGTALEGVYANERVPSADDSVVVVIGPEGGLCADEVAYLFGLNPHTAVCTLGPSILRTETAGVVAPALVAYELRRIARRGSC